MPSMRYDAIMYRRNNNDRNVSSAPAPAMITITKDDTVTTVLPYKIIKVKDDIYNLIIQDDTVTTVLRYKIIKVKDDIYNLIIQDDKVGDVMIDNFSSKTWIVTRKDNINFKVNGVNSKKHTLVPSEQGDLSLSSDSNISVSTAGTVADSTVVDSTVADSTKQSETLQAVKTVTPIGSVVIAGGSIARPKILTQAVGVVVKNFANKIENSAPIQKIENFAQNAVADVKNFANKIENSAPVQKIENFAKDAAADVANFAKNAAADVTNFAKNTAADVKNVAVNVANAVGNAAAVVGRFFKRRR